MTDKKPTVKKLKVPLGKDDQGGLINPEHAIKEERYRCPSCLDDLVLRKGVKKVPHFSHSSNTCSQESILHITAKYLIAEVCNDYLKTGIPPNIKRQCPTCTTRTTQSLETIDFDKVLVEKKLKTGFIADVALLKEEQVTCVLEIKATHAVDDHKKSSLGTPFLELNAVDVIASSMVWSPIQDTLSTFECLSCTDANTRYWRYLQSVAKDTKCWLPKGNIFRVTGFECWRDECKTEFLVFDWPKSHEGREPPEKRPHTLKYRVSKMAGTSYWANCCPSCDSIVGEFYLPPLCSEESVDTQESYTYDMSELARRFDGSGWPSYTEKAMRFSNKPAVNQFVI